MTTDSDSSAGDARLQQAFASLRVAPTTGHPSEDDWVRFTANEMTEAERVQLADHVVSCIDCEAVFRVVSLVGSDATVARTGVRHRLSGDWRWLASAAAVVLAIGLTASWAVRSRAVDPHPRDVTARPPAAAAGATVVTPPPSWASLPSAPDVRLPPSLILAMRGTEDDRQAFLNVFGAAIAPYRAGRFADAAARLAPVAERYEDVAETWFYLGTARLYSGAPAEAIEPLRRARSSEVTGEDARWLLAVALQRAGRETEARAELQEICDQGGDYGARACAALKL